MTSESTRRGHPSDIELAAWVDEPESASATGAHVDGCGPCRERIAGIEATRAALALDPPMPTDAAFLAQRERILAAIGDAPAAAIDPARPAARGKRGALRAAWIAPLAAAAAIAAVLVVGDLRRPAETTLRDETSLRETHPSLGPEAIDGRAIRPIPPVVVEAREAAETIPVEAIDEDALDAALAAAEPLAPPLSVERTAELESEFAALPEEDRSAVLVELASADFDF